MQPDRHVVFHLVLWIILSLLIATGFLFVSTEANAKEPENFAVTYKFTGLSIQQISELDKWLKGKYPDCELMKVDKEPKLRIIGVDSSSIIRFWKTPYYQYQNVIPLINSLNDSISPRP